jgi:hypothetical protein
MLLQQESQLLSSAASILLSEVRWFLHSHFGAGQVSHPALAFTWAYLFFGDVGLCLLTDVGPRLPRQFPPRRCSPNCRSSSLPKRGSLTVVRVPPSHGSRVWWPLLACSWRLV